MCKDVYLGFSMSGTSVYFGRVKKNDFFCSEHEPRSIAFKSAQVQKNAVEGETFNTNAVECGEALCPGRPTICLATSLTFSSGRPTWCSIFRSIFDFLGHIKFNPPPRLCCNFVHYFGFFEKTGVVGGLAHHKENVCGRPRIGETPEPSTRPILR